MDQKYLFKDSCWLWGPHCSYVSAHYLISLPLTWFYEQKETYPLLHLLRGHSERVLSVKRRGWIGKGSRGQGDPWWPLRGRSHVPGPRLAPAAPEPAGAPAPGTCSCSSVELTSWPSRLLPHGGHQLLKCSGWHPLLQRRRDLAEPHWPEVWEDASRRCASAHILPCCWGGSFEALRTQPICSLLGGGGHPGDRGRWRALQAWSLSSSKLNSC